MKYKNLLIVGLTSIALAGCGKKAEDAANTASTAATSGNTVALKTEIPEERIDGTPQPIKVPNLEAAPKSIPTLMVPEGTTLLSTNKPVSSSDDFPIVGNLTYITDGDKQAGSGYFVELFEGPQWVQIDLTSPAELHAIWIWHYHSQARAYHDVIVQVSNDPTFQSGVTTLFNNDYDNSAGVEKGSDKPYVDTRFGKLINAKGINAQYVRLYSNGNTANDMNHYTEVEVYGMNP